jgi:hypothetical protein
MDGELFRSELTQRLYLLLKSQAQDTLGSLERVSTAQKRQVQTKLLEWPANVRDEELSVLRSKSPEVDNLFLQVAMLYVKLSHKSTENRVVKITRPRLEDLLRSFYQNLLKNAWGASGELWKFDPLKHDFVMRECFRKSIMDSVQIVQTAAPPSVFSRNETDTEIGPDDSISNFLGPERPVSDRQEKPRAEPASFDRQMLPPPSAPLRRSQAAPASTVSSSSSSSSDSSGVPQRLASPDNEFERHKEEDDGATVFRSSSSWDAATTLRPSAATDAVSVRSAKDGAQDSRTVSFNLPHGAGSVVSSVSDSSNNSRYQSATLAKPKVLPVTPEDDGAASDSGSEDESEMPTLQITLTKDE